MFCIAVFVFFISFVKLCIGLIYILFQMKRWNVYIEKIKDIQMNMKWSTPNEVRCELSCWQNMWNRIFMTSIQFNGTENSYNLCIYKYLTLKTLVFVSLLFHSFHLTTKKNLWSKHFHSINQCKRWNSLTGEYFFF